MPKRGSSDSTTAPKRSKVDGREQIYVLHWKRWTKIEQHDEDFLSTTDWYGDANSYEEITENIVEGVQSVVEDGGGTERAYRSHASALEALSEFIRSESSVIKELMRKKAYCSLGAAKWKKVLATDMICEYSDLDLPGVEHIAVDDAVPSTASDLGFDRLEHHQNDNNHAHYHIAWGSLGVAEEDVGFKVTHMEEIQCCEEIVTHLHCWIQKLPLG